MTRIKSITELGSLYENNIFNKQHNDIVEEAKKNDKKFPKDSFPRPEETIKKSKDFDSTGPNKAMGKKASKKVSKKNNKKNRKTVSEDINSFMKSKFDKLFENVMDNDEMEFSAGPGMGPEGAEGDMGGDDDFGLGDETEGSEEVTITLDKETARKLCDMLQAQLDTESEEESDLEDLGIEDEGEDDMGEEDAEEEEGFREGIEAEKLPDSAGAKLTKGNEVGGSIKASKGKASSEVTDEVGSETKGHPLDMKSELTKPGNNKVGNLKTGGSLFGSK